MENEARTLSEATDSGTREAEFWLDQIRQAGRCEEKWRSRAEKLVCRYRAEGERADTRLNIFFSNVEILKPRVYSQRPAPDVRRRRISEDTAAQRTGRQVAQLLERSLAYAIDAGGFDDAFKSVRDDMLITGRGVLRLAYDAEIVRRRDVQVADPLDAAGPRADKASVNYLEKFRRKGEQCRNCSMYRDPGGCTAVAGEISPEGHCDLFAPALTPAQPRPPVAYVLDGVLVEPDFDDNGPFVDQKASETVEPRYVFWSDFRMSPARRWADVWWVGFRHPMDREQLEREFKDAAKGVPFPISPGMADNTYGQDHREVAEPEHPFGRAAVWEVWNRRNRTVVWVAEGHDKVLRKTGDPLRLSGFYPMPAPLYAVQTTDKMVPVPEFDLYADQADELDRLQDRIAKITEALKAVQFCDGDAVEVIDVRAARDGTVIPIGSPGRTVEDITKSIADYPIVNYATVIAQLTQRAETVKHQIYEITGLSDLSRGDTHPRETAAAQRLKAGFGDVRMTPRNEPMALFIRDTLRLVAEIQAEMFDPETLATIGGAPVTGDMARLLRDERLRNFEIEVATDSTIRPDRHQQKAEAIEFLTAVAQYLGAAAPVAAQVPQLAPLLITMLKEASRTFKFGRQVEEQVDQLADAVSGASGGAGEAMAPGPVPAPGANGLSPADGAFPAQQMGMVQ